MFKSELNLNRKNYREVVKHFTWHLSKVSHSSAQSLVDRGVNSGVSSNDSRVIATNPDRIVDVRGIDNHEITSMPLISTGGVVSTISVEVIFMLHQRANHGKNNTMHSSPQIEHNKKSR